MNPAQVTCPACRTVLADAFFNQPDFAPCPQCAVPLRIAAFPALYRPIEAGSAGERLVIDSDASCFYHPQKKAEIPCDQCGRFLCALCDVPLGDRHLCPNCVESGRQKGTLQSLTKRRIAYDTTTLMLGLLPLALGIFMWFLFLFTGPAAIIVGIYGWKKPGSLLRKNRWRFVVGMIGGLIQILIIGGIGLLMARNSLSGE
jgi:uncharacterized paraquat-inducible protein A